MFAHQHLSRSEAEEVLVRMANAEYNEAEMAAFITVYLMRSISVEELSGFRDALLGLCKRMNFSDFATIDLCGTGGDAKDTFNISTLSAFVVAGAGGKVAKHGNYGVSSVCGSSNVLEFLGYHFTNEEDKLKRQLDQAGICMMHAPLFHPALKNIAPIRKQLGVKTFFNMLGPMVNPAFPTFQLVGVFSLELARLYNYIYQQTNKQFIILHSLDGYDEISLTCPVKFIGNQIDQILQPEDFGFETLKPEQLFGGRTVAEAADIFVKILQNEGTQAQKNVVLANSASALSCIFPNKTLPECIDLARNSLETGKAQKAFKKLLELQ